jgi:hypothetical protein
MKTQSGLYWLKKKKGNRMNEIWERLFFKTPINSSFSVTLTIYKYFNYMHK